MEIATVTAWELGLVIKLYSRETKGVKTYHFFYSISVTLTNKNGCHWKFYS